MKKTCLEKSLIPACLNLRMTKILSEAYLLYKTESVTCHKDSICNDNVALVSLHGGKNNTNSWLIMVAVIRILIHVKNNFINPAGKLHHG